jgi:hypothetical protein
MDNNGAYFESNLQNFDININNIRSKLANSSKSNLLNEYEIIRPNATIHAGAAGATTTAAALNKLISINNNQDKQVKQQEQQQSVSNNVIKSNETNLNSANPNKKLESSTSSISNANKNSTRTGPNSFETKSSNR